MSRKNFLYEFLVICLGNFLLALSTQYFVVPYSILTGGVAGVAVALAPFIHVSETIIINVLVIGLFIIGYFVLGKSFALKTLISSIVYPLFVTLLDIFPYTLEIDPLLASIYTGLLTGAGVGIVFSVGASTGGMDIPPLILNQLTGIETSKFILLCDSAIVVLGLLNYPIESLLNGLISVFISSVLVDKIETSYGASRSLYVQIISDNYLTINQEILRILNRGTTIIDVHGGYTATNRKMILAVIDKREYTILLDILDKNDKNAFVITSSANSVHGEGFKLSFKQY